MEMHLRPVLEHALEDVGSKIVQRRKVSVSVGDGKSMERNGAIDPPVSTAATSSVA